MKKIKKIFVPSIYFKILAISISALISLMLFACASGEKKAETESSEQITTPPQTQPQQPPRRTENQGSILGGMKEEDKVLTGGKKGSEGSIFKRSLNESMAEAFSATPNPQVISSSLDNGLKVMVIEDERFPLVALRLFVHAGSAYEIKEQAGISHVLEHMVFKNTKRFGADGPAKIVEAVGGDINASTSFDCTIYMLDLPSDNLQLGIEVLQDMIVGAEFNKDDLATEKKVVLSELERSEDNTSSRLMKNILPMVFKGSAYSWPIIGYRDTINAISEQNLRDYIKTNYLPGSMILVAVGNVKAAEVKSMAEKTFGLMPPSKFYEPAKAIEIGSLEGPKVQIEPGPWNKVYTRIAFPYSRIGDAMEASTDVLTSLLGEGTTSLLYKKFRYDKHLVDSISASFISLERTGLISISAVLEENNLKVFWEELVKELANLKASSFNDKAIARAKLHLEDGFVRARETIGGQANKTGYFELYSLGENGETKYLHALRKVSRQDLDKVIAEALRPETLYSALLIPTNKENDKKQTEEALATLEKELSESIKNNWPGKAVVEEKSKEEQAQKTSSPTPEIIEIGTNGKVVLIPDQTLPYASLSLSFVGGDRLLTPDTQGLAVLMAMTLTRATNKRGFQEIEDFLADRISTLQASAERDIFSVEANFPKVFQADLLSLLTEILEEASFAPEELQRTKQNAIANIKRTEDRPMGLAYRYLCPFLYAPGSHYSYFHDGDPEKVKDFQRAQIVELWEKQRSQPFVLAVCGDFDRKEILELAEKLAAKQKSFATLKIPPPSFNKEKEKTLNLAERNQEHILAIFPMPDAFSSDSPALNLLQESLNGMSGILFRDLRDKEGLGYVVASQLLQTSATGFMFLYIGTSPDKADKALDGFKRKVKEVTEKPIAKEDITRAQKSMWSGYYLARQRTTPRAKEAANLLSQGFPVDHRKLLVEAAQLLTPEDVRVVAKRYLDWDNVYILRVSPK